MDSYSTIVNLFLRAFGEEFKDLKDCFYLNGIQENEKQIIELLGEENKGIIDSYKLSLIDAFDEKTYSNHCTLLNLGIKIGMELQEMLSNIKQY